MNGLGFGNSSLLQPQLSIHNEVPIDGLDLIVNKKKKVLMIYYQCLLDIVKL